MTAKKSRRGIIIREALRYEALGFSVMPLGRITKDARGKKVIAFPPSWKQCQTKREEPKDIKRWKARNIGVVTGPISNLLVLDLDSYKDGYDHNLEKSLQLPITPAAQTASGGKQLYFKWPRGLEIRNDVCIGHDGSGIDVRAAGGMVIASPSITTYGEYSWLIDPADAELADVPPKLLEILVLKTKDGSNGRTPKKKLTELVGLKEGEGRNNAMTSAVGKLLLIVKPDRWDEEVWSAAQEINNTYKPPMDLTELRSIYDSIVKIETNRRNKIEEPTKSDTLDMSPEEILKRLYGKDPKQKAAYVKRLSVFAFIFLHENPNLKVTKDGQFYDYYDGVYRAETELGLRNRILRSLTTANLGDLASPGNTTKIFNLLLANAPTMSGADVDPNILNVKNGLLDLTTMTLAPHKPEYISTAQSPASFTPDARYPQFLKFLSEVTKSDEGLISYIQEITGYCTLSSDTSQHAAFFFVGPGGNGKGTYTLIISSLVDPLQLYHAAVEQITERFGGWMLIDKRLVIIDEPNIKKFFSEIFRKYVSGEPTFAEKKGKSDLIPFIPRAKFVLTTNELPRYDEANEANARRFHIIPFTRKFEGDHVIRNLAKIIIAEERDGILLWAIEGLKRLQKRGHFVRPEIVQREHKLLKRDNSSAWAFFDENFSIAMEEARKLCAPFDKEELYTLYVTFCQRDGRAPKSAPQFIRDMKGIRDIEFAMRDDALTHFTNLLPRDAYKKLQELKDEYISRGVLKRTGNRSWNI